MAPSRLLSCSALVARFVLTVLLAGGTRHLAAQSPLSPQGKPFYLDLSAEGISTPKRLFYVEKVIDGRGGQTAIGLINHGLNNKPAAVLFRNGLEPELTAWLQQQMPPRPTDHPVALCVRQLRVGEAITLKGLGTKAMATADLVADVYERQPDGYHFVCNVADRISTRGVNADYDHIRHLASLLERCLAQASAANWEAAARRPARTLAQLPIDRPQAGRPAIVRAVAPRAGVYFTVEDFLANRPDTTAVLQLDTVRAGSFSNTAADWEGTLLLKAQVRTAGGDRVNKNNVWGFSDGRQAYMRQVNLYRPLTRQAEFFTFVGAAPVDVDAMNQQAKRFAENQGFGGGGALGGALFSGAGLGTTGQPVVYGLDWRTGLASPMLGPGLPPRHDTAFVYVYRPLGGPREAQRLLLNDHEVGQLQPGQYLELMWPHFGRPMRLSVGTPGGPTVLLAPSTTAANYVRLVPNAPLSPWQWMPARQGEAEVDALEKQRAR
ncbi:hypothetical protein [Hymenobacter ruricola]|uniref:DUF4384 domain-containing protein n=1 Tax=Hymenobacter ruricola TaxID=2791023 RepID=A0ABS0I5G6_9BACT|nr:hypothetical protein [Hymenobacter ruricola]MBF9222021.1 hypothetical protein [Hymenobacter ruricola]